VKRESRETCETRLKPALNQEETQHREPLRTRREGGEITDINPPSFLPWALGRPLSLFTLLREAGRLFAQRFLSPPREAGRLLAQRFLLLLREAGRTPRTEVSPKVCR